MEANKMTIEGFFLSDYVRLKEENEELKRKIQIKEQEEMRANTRSESLELVYNRETYVKYSNCLSRYNILSYVKGSKNKYDEIIENLKLADKELVDFFINTKINSYSRFIERTTLEGHFIVVSTTTKFTRKYVYDFDKPSELKMFCEKYSGDNEKLYTIIEEDKIIAGIAEEIREFINNNKEEMLEATKETRDE